MTMSADEAGEPGRQQGAAVESPTSPAAAEEPAVVPPERAAVAPEMRSRSSRRLRPFSPRRIWRVAGEIAIVTLGVIVAFALNAWWTERGERRQEQVHLRALISDFEWNRGALGEVVERQERVSQAAIDLLEIARSEPGAPAERVQPLLGRVFASSRFEPTTGAYSALINSAGLTLLRNSDLRAALATFAARIESRYGERFADEIYLSFIQDYLGQGVVADSARGGPSTRSYAPLLASPRFQEHLAIRYATERDVAGHYRRLMSEAQNVLDLLRSELR